MEQGYFDFMEKEPSRERLPTSPEIYLLRHGELSLIDRRLSILDFPENELTTDFIAVLSGEVVYRPITGNPLPPNDVLTSSENQINLLNIRDPETTIFKYQGQRKAPGMGLHYDLIDAMDYEDLTEDSEGLVARTDLGQGVLLESKVGWRSAFEEDLEERRVLRNGKVVYHEVVESDCEGDVLVDVRTYEPGDWEKEVEKEAIRRNAAA